MKARVPAPGSSGASRVRFARNSRWALFSWLTFPQVKERRNEPSVDGARTPPNSVSIAPCRSRSMSSIESAPAAMPAARQATLRPAFAPGSPPGRTCAAARSCSPARSASAASGTRPVCDTRFGSSNDAHVFASACNNCTCKVSSRAGTWQLQQLPSSQFRGHLSYYFHRNRGEFPGGSRLSCSRRPGVSRLGSS